MHVPLVSLILAFSVSGLAACAAPNPADLQPSPDYRPASAPPAARVRYRCDGARQFEAYFAEAAVQLSVAGHLVRLPRVRAGDGAKYQAAVPGGRMILWIAEDASYLATPSRRYRRCRARPLAEGRDEAVAAPPPG